MLDAYFLWQERLYRSLYDSIRKKNQTDFSMKINKKEGKYIDALFSKTLLPFYLIEVFFVILVFTIIKN